MPRRVHRVDEGHRDRDGADRAQRAGRQHEEVAAGLAVARRVGQRAIGSGHQQTSRILWRAASGETVELTCGPERLDLRCGETLRAPRELCAATAREERPDLYAAELDRYGGDRMLAEVLPFAAALSPVAGAGGSR